MKRFQKLMIGHGLLVLLAAMLSGLMLGFGLIGGFEVYPGKIVPMPYYGTTEGWARAHTGGVTNGLMIIGVALALPLIPLSQRMLKLTAYGLIYIGWANTAFYWLGNASGNRAMSFGDSPLGASNLPGVIGFGAALIGAILIFWLLGNAAMRVLGDKSQ